MRIPRTTTQHITYSNHATGFAAIIWNTDSESQPFRVVFRDTQAGETIGAKDCETIEHAEREARSFVS